MLIIWSVGTGSNRVFARLAVCLAFCSVCVYATADEIVVKGARYRDVLVLKTSSTYYVQIPWEGRTISVRAGKVDESTVSINEDPFYRDELKREYREAKKLRDAGKTVRVKDDPTFRVQARSSSTDYDPFKAGGTAGGGLGMARSQMQSMMAGAGLQFQKGPGRDGMPSVIAQVPTGGHIELFGPANRLMGVEVVVTVPAAQLETAASQMQGFAGQAGAGNAAEIAAMFREAQKSGQSQRTMDGASITIAIQESDGMAELKMTTMAPK